MNGDAANDSSNNPDSRRTQRVIGWGLAEDALLRPWIETPLPRKLAATLVPNRTCSAVRARLAHLRAERGINLGHPTDDGELKQRRARAESGSAKMIEAMRKAGFCGQASNSDR